MRTSKKPLRKAASLRRLTWRERWNRLLQPRDGVLSSAHRAMAEIGVRPTEYQLEHSRLPKVGCVLIVTLMRHDDVFWLHLPHIERRLMDRLGEDGWKVARLLFTRRADDSLEHRCNPSELKSLMRLHRRVLGIGAASAPRKSNTEDYDRHQEAELAAAFLSDTDAG